MSLILKKISVFTGCGPKFLFSKCCILTCIDYKNCYTYVENHEHSNELSKAKRHSKFERRKSWHHCRSSFSNHVRNTSNMNIYWCKRCYGDVHKLRWKGIEDFWTPLPPSISFNEFFFSEMFLMGLLESKSPTRMSSLKSISFNLELRISVPQKNAPSLSPWIL